ncbi:MAG: L-aspartate oxidase [Elusimicrobia bacterium]|nr:L-aspartate oxidase [Elusimicrobiota bacterium]
MVHSSDFLVLGSGISGLLAAYKLASLGTVHVVTKREASEANTRYAQGGIAAVTAAGDSFDQHLADTMNAGAGLCREPIVRIAVEEGPARIRELQELGVRFSPGSGGSPDLGLEAGHSQRRILHAGDITGEEIERALLAACRRHSNIRFFEKHLAINLIRAPAGSIRGAYVMERDGGAIHAFIATSTLLASGGAGKVYIYTSNPDTATGDGMAMAFRAGAPLSNMEFVQFHPTCLFHPKAKSFLLSEALRGEGGRLLLKSGRAFMKSYNAAAELAPRDIVARAIDSELKKSGDEHVLLDMTNKSRDFLKGRFPNIYDKLLGLGIDMAVDPIPVVPAAHFFCGGVRTDEWGRTELPGLFAIGEVADTGLHGANRLASNSLLEGCVFAHRAYLKLKEERRGPSAPAFEPPAWNPGKAVPLDEAVVISQNWDEIRRLMWNYVGIVRSNRRLERALRRMSLLNAEIEQYYWDFILTPDLVELRNLAEVATAVILSAMARKESRGLHYNLDYPSALETERHDTVLRKSQALKALLV